MYYLIVGFLPGDIEELERHLLQKQQDLGKDYSRNKFIRDSLELFERFPSEPLKIHRADLYRRDDLGGRRNIPILLTPQCLEILTHYQEEFKASRMEIIRQALLNNVQSEDKEWLSPLYVPPKIEQEWTKIFVAGVSINERLHLKRNSINVLAHRKAINHTDIGKRRYYCFGDIVKALKLKKEISENLFEYYSSKNTLIMKPIESFFLYS